MDIAQPLNSKTFEVNQPDNVERKSLKSLIEKVADKTDDQILGNAGLPPVNNNNIKPHKDNDEGGLHPNNNNNNSPAVSDVTNCVQTSDRLEGGD